MAAVFQRMCLSCSSYLRVFATRQGILVPRKIIPYTKQVISQSQFTHVVAQSDAEKRIADKIQSQLNVSKIEVEDISGGCGSMYRIFVAAAEFQGKRTIQQHRMVNDILCDEVKDMHGLTLQTTPS